MKFALLRAMAALVLMMPYASHADFNRVCRGGNLPQYEKEMKKAVKLRLTEQGIAYRRVAVKFMGLERSRSRYANDFVSDLAIEGSATPSVKFRGSFPELVPCTVTGFARITIAYQDMSKSITMSPISAPGTMLFAARKVYPKDSTAGD